MIDINKIVFHNTILAKAKEQGQGEAIAYYFQQLCQLDNIIILVGSGFTQHIGGPLISDLAKDILPQVILNSLKAFVSVSEAKVNLWKNIWKIDDNTKDRLLKNIKEKKDDTVSISELEKAVLNKNIENVINDLKTVIEGLKVLGSEEEIIKDSLEKIEEGIVRIIKDITPDIDAQNFAGFCKKIHEYRYFIKRLIEYRRPQQPRVKIFTTNYDRVIELACDLDGIHCITGFEGRDIRIFNPTIFDLNINLKATGQSSIYFGNVIHLYKLHGSINWRRVSIEGIDEIIQDNQVAKGAIIYPCCTKYYESLEMPFGEMFRRFGECIAQPQTVILTLGYGFNDEHINQMLFRALKNPSCQLVCVEPKAGENVKDDARVSEFLKNLIALSNPKGDNSIGESRVCVIGGEFSKFPAILDLLVPPVELENPTEEAKKLISKLISLGNA